MTYVAVVTGGTRGIGAAISRTLRNAGMTVAANYCGNDDGAMAFSERTGIAVFKWDVGDYEACKDGIRKIEAHIGPVDVLVNNAGIPRDPTMLKLTHQQWHAVIDVNIGVRLNMAQMAFEGMK